MTEREMLRLILVNQAYILSGVSGNIIGHTESEAMLAQAQMTLDLVKKDEEDEKENING